VTGHRPGSDARPRRGGGSLIPERDEIRRQAQLPFRHAVSIAWRNIRMRLGRSLLVASGIVLGLAFLSYMLMSDSLARAFVEFGPSQRVQELQRLGELTLLDDADARIQTWWMVGLALLVCFVGVLNAMLLSVTERFGEIGTMKCLGAMDSLILRLFLLESLFQGLAGTTIGIVLGGLLALVEGSARYGGSIWTIAPWPELAATAGLALLAGVILTVAGAAYPAWHAARMKPVEAMRVEV
jgi:predicted lysophospholipase L1 biosynthesis ABC-type transport system permease subunit